VISDEFTFENVRTVAQAVSSYVTKHGLTSRGIMVGYDTRFLSEQFAEEIVKVLHANGISCFLSDRDIPTPVLAFSVKDKHAGGAVMVTASHNPPQYCGIKFIAEYAGPASQPITDEIVSFLGQQLSKTSKTTQKTERFNPLHRYRNHIDELIDFDAIKEARLKVAYDPLWGTGRDYLDRILQELGADLTVIHGSRDVLFGGITPEPVGEHLKELKDTVVANKCSVGLATDPDADRFGIVDEKGNYVSANMVLSVLLEYILKERKDTGVVVRSIATTHFLDKIAEAHGVTVREVPVGFKHIAEVMLKETVVLGGEESGGMTIGDHIPEKDGMLACLLVCEMLARNKKPLSKIIEDIAKKYGPVYNRRVNLKLTEATRDKLMAELLSAPPARMAKQKLTHVTKIDGVKLVFDDGSWILARPSGTEPIVRTYYESDSMDKLKEMMTSFESFASSVIA
jgi:alpha-D-glucose phosphate-specific phosphoglucomutase